MKTIRTSAGPFAERPHFDPGEIDRICTAELKKVNLFPRAPQAVRIDRFIEKRFRLTPNYEDDLPQGVVGFTEFGNEGAARIVVARSLAEEDTPAAQRRVRATLAHEAGHALLHAHLFAVQSLSGKLFDADTTRGPQILCREVPVADHDSRRPKTSWSEFQANAAIGGLLLPHALVEAALASFRVTAGAFDSFIIDPGRWEEAVCLLADVFDVNPVVARIRLDALYGHQKSGQMAL